MQVDVTFYETKQAPKNPIPRLVLSEDERRALRALAAGPGGIDGMMKAGLRVGRSTIEAALSGGRITKVSAERLRFAIRAAAEPPAGDCKHGAHWGAVLLVGKPALCDRGGVRAASGICCYS